MALTKTTGFLSLASILMLAALPAVVGCATPDTGDDTPAPTKPRKEKPETNPEEETNPNPETSIGDPVPATPPPAPAAAPLIYAHTADSLYTFDSAAKKLTLVGKLACLAANDRLLDIAVDGKGVVFGTTDQAFIAVNPKDATCTRIVAKTKLPNSLSFVPAGTLEAGAEALVGYAYDASSKAVKYVQIDTVNGSMTDIGLLNPPNAATKYVSSGDIFSVAKDGNKTYLTVHEDSLTDSPDQLAEIDPKTGAIKTIVGNTLQSDIYGLAYWGGKAYGFSGDGNVTEINITTGVSNLITKLEKDAVAVPWFGAGVTTEAPTTR